jgi:diguanylate cyclase (GGDEF)-like protein/PAS domain S-box-containing protein
MITDVRANILVVNTAYLRLSGYTEADLIGKQPNRVRSERHDDAFWAAMWQALTQQKQWSGKVWNLRKDGSEYCVWHTITAVHDLRGRVVRYVAVSRDITEQQAKESDLWQRANFDPLTRLANRTRFYDRLAHAVTASARHQQCFAVCYLDLDRFKPVNDTLGHAAGDDLLRQVALRMLGTLRREDTLARIGGDEFALLMPRIASSKGAVAAAEKILAALHSSFVLDAGTVDIGISVGIAIYPEHGETAEALVAAADQALYSAKVGGRNTWRLAGTASLDESLGKLPINPII